MITGSFPVALEPGWAQVTFTSLAVGRAVLGASYGIGDIGEYDTLGGTRTWNPDGTITTTAALPQAGDLRVLSGGTLSAEETYTQPLPASLTIDSINAGAAVQYNATGVPIVVSGGSGLTATGNTVQLTGEFGTLNLPVTRFSATDGTFDFPNNVLAALGFPGSLVSVQLINGAAEAGTGSLTLAVDPADDPGLLTLGPSALTAPNSPWAGQGLATGDQVYIKDIGGLGYQAASDWANGNPIFSAAQLPAVFNWWGKDVTNTLPVYNTSSADGSALLNFSTNTPPVLVVPTADQPVNEGDPWTLTIPAGAATDADGEVVTLSVSLVGGAALPSWIGYNSGTRTFTAIPDQAQVGAYDILLTYSDPNGATVTDSFTLTVAETNDAPVVAAPIAPLTVIPGTPTTTVIPAGTFIDEEGAILTWSATLTGGAPLPAWASFDPATRTLTTNTSMADAGVYGFDISVFDGVNTTTTTMSVVVSSGATVLRLKALNDVDIPVQQTVGWHIFTAEDNPGGPVASGTGVTSATGEIELPYGSAPGELVYVWFYALDGSWRDTVQATTETV